MPKEVTKYVAGFDTYNDDKLTLVAFKMKDTPKQLALVEEDTQEYRQALHFLNRRVFNKSSEYEMGKLANDARGAYLHLYYMMKKVVKDARTKLDFVTGLKRQVEEELHRA